MTYFLAAGGTVDVNALRSSADTLSSGSISGIFTQDGSYFYRVDNPLIGEQFGFLSDVSIADFGGGFAALQNVTQLNGIQVFQVARSPNGTFGINASAGSTNSALDAVLGARYPSYMNNSIYETFTMGAGQSSSAYLPEFYIRVTGSATAFDSVYGQLGFNAPDDGRFLITRGAIGGQRDAAWGNWVDVVTQGSTPPTTPPVAPPVTPPVVPPVTPPTTPPTGPSQPVTLNDTIRALDAINADVASTNIRLDGIRTELAAQQERLAALGQQQSGENILLALDAITVIGQYAKVGLAFTTPASVLHHALELHSVTAAGYGAMTAVAALFRDGITEEGLGRAMYSVSKFIAEAASFENAKRFIEIADAAQATAAFIAHHENYQTSFAQIQQNTALTQQRIYELQRQERLLEEHLYGAPQADSASPHAVQSFAFQETTTGAVLSGPNGFLILEAGSYLSLPDNTGGPNTAIMLFGQDQTVVVGTGASVIDGSESIRDQVVLYGNVNSYSIRGGPEYAMLFERPNASTIVMDVDRVRFDDAIIALDVNGNAGDAYRVYQAAFDRTPDRPGLSYWVNQMDDGMALSQVALNFILSPEFTATYGNINAMSNAQFVTVLYQNVLHRAPDQAGLNYWLNDLAHGNVRHAVLAAFSESAENQANVSVQLLHGINLDPHAFI